MGCQAGRPFGPWSRHQAELRLPGWQALWALFKASQHAEPRLAGFWPLFKPPGDLLVPAIWLARQCSQQTAEFALALRNYQASWQQFHHGGYYSWLCFMGGFLHVAGFSRFVLCGQAYISALTDCMMLCGCGLVVVRAAQVFLPPGMAAAWTVLLLCVAAPGVLVRLYHASHGMG